MPALTSRLNLSVACAVLGAASLLTSCNGNPFYEDLAPCETRHAVRFQWDTNMVGADAFRGNVHSVAIYGFDQNDKLAFHFAEKGDALAMQGYTLPITGVAPGEYTIVAWCGLDNDGTRSESFIVSDTEMGVTTRQELLCRMERDIHDDGTHHSSENLYDLYHGTSYGVQIYAKNDMDHQGDHVYTINLTKDTNNVRIMLQQMGKDVNVEDFSYRIEEANGTLGCDNELQTDETINYEPFNTENGVAGVEETRAGAITNVGIAIADLKMSRLMARRPSMLTIRNSDGSTVLQIPMTQYALLAKGYEAETFTDQEYLDRQDNYRLMFFLDSDGNWSSSRIVVNSWTIYKQPGTLE
ncbi:MAG: FimB/Mfa2 family fimbrial subunit [Muribaculaceae bacterium]|nr:FimB/Mfa2 family fimbrial subunit [Muribaculaceae bacterium]